LNRKRSSQARSLLLVDVGRGAPNENPVRGDVAEYRVVAPAEKLIRLAGLCRIPMNKAGRREKRRLNWSGGLSLKREKRGRRRVPLLFASNAGCFGANVLLDNAQETSISGTIVEVPITE
jgi:hypothetical protein